MVLGDAALMSNWNDFPHDASEFSFAGEALEAAWADLHTGDREPWPDVAHLQNDAGKAPCSGSAGL